MSQKYDEYLHEHISNVNRAGEWLIDHGLVPRGTEERLRVLLSAHDNSKYDASEYDDYDAYFYGKGKEDPATKEAFDYVYEMIADWWSFSWKSGDLKTVFDWYADHSPKMILSENTRKLVDKTLDRIDETLTD